MGSNTEPEQVTVNSLQFCDQRPNRLRSWWNRDSSKAFNPLTVGGRMNVRADTTDSFQQVKILNPVATFDCLFNSPVSVAQPHRSGSHNFAVYGEGKVSRFLQRRVLWSDGDSKAFHGTPQSSSASLRSG